MLPPEVAKPALSELLARIAKSGQGSFLAVLKRFGEKPAVGMLSFPRPGVTIALDFPMLGDKTLRLLDGLDEVVVAVGGALYPAKDARMNHIKFYCHHDSKENYLKLKDPIFLSDFSSRIKLSR